MGLLGAYQQYWQMAEERKKKAAAEAAAQAQPAPGGFRSSGAPQGVAADTSTSLLDQLRAMQGQQQTAQQGKESEQLGLVDAFGGTEKRRIRQGAVQAGASANQNLVSRGLGNSTIVNSVQQGIQRDKQTALGDVNERKALMQASIIGQRDTTDPMAGLYANLLMRQPAESIDLAALTGDPKKKRRTMA
jgi:hypothetical protein